ncbi:MULTISPECIES: helix-turn-helix domain-containing protein [unclassified Sedimentibacter]|uniref:helix-turn-helix domain-containing protein n=1 Tax=unclassified Sedimentibacter TaxID=2649220 RepID=UPI0027E109CD|nr:helix-turn-helix transcriptional regulator [Sedimentibacter sp. MB35-C1]WMJ77263.1 helix-turn-helix transcriptional regulator [Sedimentibacter sp. MB35-C1]
MEENITLQIGKRLRKRREKLNMTREVFAEKAGISPQFLAEIENGKKGMSVATLYKICNNFRISADYLLFGTISSKPLSDATKEASPILSEPYRSYTEDIMEIVNDIINESQGNYRKK